MAKVSRQAVVREVTRQLAGKHADSKAIMQSLAAYLIENKITDDAALYLNDIADELFRQTGHLAVELTTAHPLSDSVRNNLIAYLKETTTATSVALHEAVDESLIGGFVAKTPSAELDASVRHTLRQLTGIA